MIPVKVGCGPKHKNPAAWISKQVCRIAASPLRTVAVIGRSHGPNEQSERHKYVTGPMTGLRASVEDDLATLFE